MQRLFNGSSNSSAVHSDKWNILYEEITQIDDLSKYKDQVTSIFANVVGTADAEGTKYTFVDAYKIIEILKKLIESNWNLAKYAVLSKKKKKTDLWYRAPRIVAILSRNMDNVVAAEMKLVNEYITYFKKKIPEYRDLKQVEATFFRVNDYLVYLTDKRNLSYDPQRVQKLRDSSVSQYVVKEMGNLDSVAEKATAFEKLNALAQNPFDHIKEIYEELKYFDQLIAEKNEKFKSGIDVSVNAQIEEYRKHILASLTKMISIGQEVTA